MSSIQKLIEEGIRADRLRKKDPAFSAPPLLYGIQWKGHDGRRHQRTNVRFNSRNIVACGGCVRGRVPVRTPTGERTHETRKHVDCDGTGVRLNKRYGRCGKGGR